MGNKINSKQKGKTGELEFSKELRNHGFSEARRSQQFCGDAGDADVVGTPGIHVEVKRVEKLNIDTAMEQAINDSKDDSIPVVAHRKNRKPWKVTMLFDDWIRFYKAFLGGGK